MWIVYDNEEGLVGTFNNYDKALSEYERCKEAQRNWVSGEGEFSTDETVILAKVEKHFYSYDTNKPVIEEDDEGNEIETKDTYWDFKEKSY